MQPEKKQLEVLLMQYFRECNAEFPKGKLIPSESPDFIVILKTRNRIGIELTRLNPLNTRHPGLHEIEQKLLRERIIESAKTLFEQTSSMRLFVKFLFSDNHPVKAERELSVTVQLANAIRKMVEGKKQDSFFYNITGRENLPDGIENILIVNHPEMESSIWERSNNLGISEDVLGDIRETIHKKDEKMRLYQRQSLNSYWLLIVTDRLRGVKNFNLHNKIMNHVFHSRFQQVFLFDLIKSDVYRLV
jgi:hypothetical protein